MSPLPTININRGEGGLGRALPNQDHVSGYIQYFANTDLPTGWATGWVTATAYAVGDVVVESGNIYRCLIAHTSGTFATDLGNGNWVQDETATTRVKEIKSIEQAENLGIAEGSTTHRVLWYHINEYFRIQPQGVLWVGLFNTTGKDLTEVIELQNFAEGVIRQVGVYDTDTFTAANVNTLQTQATALEGDDKPLSIIYTADVSATANLTTLPDLRALTNKNVSVAIGQDGGLAGKALYDLEAETIGSVGAVLGAVSLAKVSESIAWVAKFNLVDSAGLEFDVPAFGNGQLFKDLSTTDIESIHDLGYIFIRKFVGLQGSFFNDTPTAIAIDSDFAYIENNRTIDKAVRLVRLALLQNLNGPVFVDPSTEELAEESIALIKSVAEGPLEDMQVDQELSGDDDTPGFAVIIDPNQKVLSTSEVELAIQLVPVGVGRTITVNIGFTTQITTT